MESTQVEGQQSEPAQTDPDQVQSVNVVASQAQPTKEEPVKVEAANVEPVTQSQQPTQTEPANVEPVTQSQPTQTEPPKVETANIEPVTQSQPTQTEPPKVEAANIEPVTQSQPTQTEPAKVEAANVEPVTQSQPTQTEPAKMEAENAGSITQTQPVQTEPAKVDSMNMEPAKLEGAQTEQEPQVRCNQAETDRKRLVAMELEIDALNDVGGEGEEQKKNTLSRDEKMEYEENAKLRKMVAELKETLREKTLTLTRKSLETEALEIQITALKEVTILSKGMLDIRNTENLQLKDQIDSMQEKITAERERHNSILQKTERAATINSELQTEYHNQVKLFGELKESYEKKLAALQAEIKRLEAMQNSTPP